jgi:hypothetical protein
MAVRLNDEHDLNDACITLEKPLQNGHDNALQSSSSGDFRTEEELSASSY